MARVRPPSPTPPQIRGILCPYCGNISADPRRCDRCAGHFDPLSRQATQNAMGPWFIRDTSSPFRPGCSYETLRDLIRRGKITRESIIRGPTTRQFWNFAGRTPTVAHLFGVCHNCFAAVNPQEFSCASCGAVFTPETDRQHLGLAPVHLLPGEASPEIIAATAADSRPVPASKPQRSSREVPSPLPATPLAPDEAPAGFSAAAKLGIALAILVFAGSVGYGTWRLANMVGQPPPRPPTPIQPAPTATPVAPATTTKPASEATANPPQLAPTVPEPATPTSAPPADTGAAFRDEITAALRSDILDAPALITRIEQWKRANPSHAADADALLELIRRRAEQLKLRKTP